MKNNFLLRPAVRVQQPLGVFYAFSLSAQILNKLTYSQPAEFQKKMEEEANESLGFPFFGTQRKESKSRLHEISKFIRSSEATFPNAIILAANYDEQGRLLNDEEDKAISLQVSMATMVDGILKSISKNPKEDRYHIRRPENISIGRESLSKIEDLPLRDFYLTMNDKAIYQILINYFDAVEQKIWNKSVKDSYLKKTVGIQALFDVLQYLLNKLEINDTNFSKESLYSRFEAFEKIDPDGKKYQASGIGKTQIKNDILGELKKTFNDKS